MRFDDEEIGGAEHGPIRFRFYGDKAAAMKRVRTGRILLGNHKLRMQQGGLTDSHYEVNLPDGTKIRVQSIMINGQAHIDEVHIAVPSRGGKITVKEDIYFAYSLVSPDMILNESLTRDYLDIYGFEPDGSEGLISTQDSEWNNLDVAWFELTPNFHITNEQWYAHFDLTIYRRWTDGSDPEGSWFYGEGHTTNGMATLSTYTDKTYLEEDKKLKYLATSPHESFAFDMEFYDNTAIIQSEDRNKYEYSMHIECDPKEKVLTTELHVGLDQMVKPMEDGDYPFEHFIGVSERTLKTTIQPGWYVYKVRINPKSIDAAFTAVQSNITARLRMELGKKPGKVLVKYFDINFNIEYARSQPYGNGENYFWHGALLINLKSGEYKYYDGSERVFESLESKTGYYSWTDPKDITTKPTSSGSYKEGEY